MKFSLVIVSSLFLVNSAIASNNWVSSNQQPVKDGRGECVRNGFWTPATAHPQCVPDLQPLPKPPAPTPPPVPAKPVSPPPPPAPAPQVIKAPTKVTFQAETLFDFDRSVIKPEGRVVLDGFITSLNGSRARYDTVIVIGHTDSIGIDEYNIRLGLRRAEAVKAYLISKGIDSRTIRTSSKGEREPVADNKTAQGRAKNRRVVIEVVGLK
jgi:OOP family OmpA-OmpF porin